MKIEINIVHETKYALLRETFVMTASEYDSLNNVEGIIALKISEMRNNITNEVIRMERNPATEPEMN